MLDVEREREDVEDATNFLDDRYRKEMDAESGQNVTPCAILDGAESCVFRSDWRFQITSNTSRSRFV